MALESVQAVRQAELKAAQIEKDALAAKEALLSETRQKAKDLVDSKVKEAQAKAENDLRAAERRSMELMEEVKLRAEKEVIFMKELVKNKEQAAIDLVLSSLI
jgi:F0F1-type ATP synthase membrane subunit b/b'